MIYSKVFGQAEHVVLREAKQFARAESTAIGALFVRLAVVEVRKLYLPAGYPSMYDYGVGELGLSEDAALRRLNAARVARDFPVLFDALADGRIQLTTILTLSPYLNAGNATELVQAAAHKKVWELRDWLACRFPGAVLPTKVVGVDAAGTRTIMASEAGAGLFDCPLVDGVVNSHAPARPVPIKSDDFASMRVPLPGRAKIEPRSSEYVAYQFSAQRSTHDKLRRAQELLGHAVAANDLGGVFDRVLDALIEKLEKRRFAATAAPRSTHGRRSGNARHIPAHVRRLVRERDGERCTFTSAAGHRCECRRGLEFDHVTPVARGGESSAANLRLRCRAHNQYEAERVFGEGFMREKREAAKARAEQRRRAKSGAEAGLTSMRDDRRQVARPELRQRCAEAELIASRAEAGKVAMPAVKQTALESDFTVTRAERDQFSESNLQPALEADLADVRAALRELRFTKAEIESGLASAVILPNGATPEDRLRAALKALKLRSARKELPMAMATA